MSTAVKKKCVCIGSAIKVFPQAPFLDKYSPNRHAIIRYRPAGSEKDAVIRTFIHSSLEKTFWALESPHFLFDAHFETDKASGLPLKVKIAFARTGVSYDIDVYFMKSIVQGSCVPIKRIDTISDIIESATRTFHLFWKYQPKASAVDLSALRTFYYSGSAKTVLTKDLASYFGVDSRSATTFKISRRNAARIHSTREDIETHIATALTAIKFTSAHLSLVFDYGFNIKSAYYLSNAKAVDILCVMKENIIGIKSVRSDFTSSEISDIIQCVQLKENCNYGKSIGAFLVYSKIIELSTRSIPCTKATTWLLSNGSIHYNEPSLEDKSDVSSSLRGHVDYIENGDLFCSSEYMKVYKSLYHTRTGLTTNGVIKSVNYITMSPWNADNYTDHLHLSFETSFIFILSNEIFTIFSKAWPMFTSVMLVTAGEIANPSLVSMSGVIKNIFVVGIDTEPISTLGIKFQWIACSIEASKVRDASLIVQTTLPYWRIDNPLRWSLLPSVPNTNKPTNTNEAIHHLEYNFPCIHVSSFDDMEQLMNTNFSKSIFVVADHKATRQYYNTLAESHTSPPLKSSGRKFLRGSNNTSMMSVDWEISRHSSDLESPHSDNFVIRHFNMKTFMDQRLGDFKVISELTHKIMYECTVFLLCFSDKEIHKFYLEELERLVMLGVMSINIVIPSIPFTEKLKACIKSESHYVSSACKNLVTHVVQ